MKILRAAIAVLAGVQAPAFAQQLESYGRADLAGLTVDASVVLRATIGKASKLSEKLSPDLPDGHRRLLVVADTRNLLVAPGFVPRRVEYLVDVPVDSRGKLPKLKGADVLLFLTPGAAPGQYRLVRPWAQVPWTSDADGYVRAIAAEKLDPALAGLAVTGLGQAFHVPGNLPGESESQIFVQTESERPVSLVVLSRPGMERSVSVATGDVIDAAAKPVADGSLLWYQLACGLPSALPAASVATLDTENADAVRSDYRFAMDAMARCDRKHGATR
jgi:hypothetical protein